MRVLLTGARAPATLELARLCAHAGHEVHVADTHRWHVCRGSRHISGVHRLPPPRGAHDAYTLAVRALVARLGIEVIVPTCEEVFHLASRREDVGTRVACEPLTVLAPLHDKWRFVAACDAAGVRRPATWLLEQVTALPQLPTGSYILKPRYSRFATRVRTWTTGDDLPPRSGMRDREWIAQEQLRGTVFCSWSIASRGRLDAHATYETDATAGPRGAAIAFHSVRHAGVLAWVRQFIGHHALSGQFAFDFIEAPSGLHAVECNPRLTSGVHCFRDMPDVVHTLLGSDAPAPRAMLEPGPGQHFRSRLALMLYGAARRPGSSFLEARDDPWPQRLQWMSWLHLLASSALARTSPRVWSTRDIEWNGE